MEKLAKKGLNVQAGCSGRQAPGASVSFKNSLRLLFFFFFFLCREQGTEQCYRGFNSLFVLLEEHIGDHECVNWCSEQYGNDTDVTL